MKINTFLTFSILLWFFILNFFPLQIAAEGIPSESAQTENSDEPLFDNQEAASHYQKGVQFYQKRIFAKSIEELEKAVEINPDFTEAYYLLGYAYYKEGKMDLSRDAFNQAYSLDPKYSPLSKK
ncbi:MAG: tetratricopeptide repeat protein [Nitrospiria bacterium]